MTQTITRPRTAMSNDELLRVAPSIFATQPWDRMSAKYAFIPTISVVEKMRTEGFVPVSAMQSRTRIEGRGEFTKHMIRFQDRRNGEVPAIRSLGQLFPELVLTNSHDGKSSYVLEAGIFRLVCMNGMVVADSTVSHVNVRHSGNPGDVIDASYEVIEHFPRVLESIETFSQLRLNDAERNAYGEAALALRYDEGTAPVSVEQVIRPRRSDDAEKTLWNTFNTVQENLLAGGLKGRNTETRRRLTTRAVSGISEGTKLNKALWTLTEKMRELKG